MTPPAARRHLTWHYHCPAVAPRPPRRSVAAAPTPTQRSFSRPSASDGLRSCGACSIHKHFSRKGNSGVTLGSWRPLGVSRAIIAKESNNKIFKKCIPKLLTNRSKICRKSPKDHSKIIQNQELRIMVDFGALWFSVMGYPHEKSNDAQAPRKRRRRRRRRRGD